MCKYKHFLITLFNLRNKRIQDKQKWFTYRLNIFELLTVPSILSNDSNFSWIIICDQETSQKDAGLILRAANHDRRINLIKLDRPVTFQDRHNSVIRHLVQSLLAGVKKDLVLTTLIDNDDIVCDTFFQTLYQTVNQCLENEKPILFEPNKEYIVSLRSKRFGERPRPIHPSTATIPSILDTTTIPIITVRHIPHGHLIRYCKQYVRLNTTYIHTSHNKNVETYKYWNDRNVHFRRNLSDITSEFQYGLKRIDELDTPIQSRDGDSNWR